jgi:nucleotide-binding universal stress UspA family protein
MKNILLPVHDDAGQEARLQAALDITRALGGHLTCLGVVDVPVLPADAWSGTAQAVLAEAAREQEAPNAEQLRTRLADEDLSWDWRDVTGDMADSLAAAARLADLIVTSPRVQGFLGAGERDLAAELLTHTRTPVLSVPQGASGFVPDGRALVAWNGSDQVMDALRAATPLLRLAARVLLVEIDDGTVRLPVEEAAAYLARQGMKAAVRRDAGHHAPVATMLRDTVRTGRFDYVVMGAFSRFRITEKLLGGVSRDMLRFSPVPLFMAH